MEFQGEGSDTQWGDLLGAAGTNQLPGDLLIQIVSRLPVKSILRFKSVCRAWYFLFNHPVFIQRHCRIASSFAKMNNSLSFFVHTICDEGKGHLFSLLLDSSCGGHVLIDLDLSFEADYLAVMGSINGLVCLTLNMMATSIMFWNPATRKHSLIPNPRLLPGRGENVLSGLAYDRKTDIYKVVRVVYSYAAGMAPARVEIYNTGTNTWRMTEIIGFPGNMLWRRSGVVAGGDLYWLSPRGSERSNLQQLIMSFDASSEAFTFHPIPPDGKPYPLDWVSLQSWSLEAMGNHPVLMYCEYKDDLYEICIERVTIRKLIKSDDGGRDSFHIENLIVEPLLELSRIIHIFGNGKIIAEDPNENLILYDQEDIKDCRELCWDFHDSDLVDYTESLVWPSRLA